MFEEIIEIHKNKILSIFKNNNITYLEDIEKSNDVPHWIKKYFIAKFNNEIHKLKSLISENSLFDTSNDEVQSAWQSYELAIKSNSKLEYVTLNDWINEAILHYFNFLIRPRFTLVNFIFQNDYEKSVDYIINQLSYFESSHYLINQLNFYFDNYKNNAGNSISKREFQNIIKEIDDDYFKNKTPDEFFELFDPICDFFNIENHTQQFLPVSAFKIFLSDKNWNEIENALIEIQHKTHSVLWTKAQVIEFLNNYNNIDIENMISNQIPLFNENEEE